MLNKSARLLGLDLSQRLSNRIIKEFPFEYASGNGSREVIRAISALVDRSGTLTDKLWEWGELAFDQWVADDLDQNLDAVYGYEHAALFTFRRAKAYGIPIIYEVPSPDPLFVENIYKAEIKKYSDLGSPYQKRLKDRLDVRMRRRHEEWKLADLVIVNSSLTRSSYELAGLDTSKAAVIPLAAPPVVRSAGPYKKEGPIRFIWAGTFGIRKGAHYLLEAWKKLKFQEGRARLDIYGKITLPKLALGSVPKGIYYHGPISQQELFQKYLESHLLLFPTLCDGFGLVVTEAMAHGLPVLTTAQAGSSELVVDGKNGVIVSAGEVDPLVERMQACIDGKVDLSSMAERAKETARNWQWSDYRIALTSELEKLLEK